MARILLQKYASLIGRGEQILTYALCHAWRIAKPTLTLTLTLLRFQSPISVRNPNPNLLYFGRLKLRVNCGQNRADSG